MNLDTFVEWFAWAGVVIPLSVLAWQAYRWVQLRKEEIEQKRYHKIFEVAENLGQARGSIVSKVIAAYELRKFPDYADVIIRICEGADVRGDAANLLQKELDLTAEQMKKAKKK